MGFWDFLRRKKDTTSLRVSPNRRWRYAADGTTKIEVD